MSSASPLMALLADVPVVVVLRAPSPDSVVAAASTLARAGVRCVEVTLTTPDAPRLIEELAPLGADGVLVGAGTVTDPEGARRAVAAGARFLVAPNVDGEVIAAARELGVDLLPGAFSPTEIAQAHAAGVPAVKVFPASVGGPGYIKAVLDPLPGVALIPTGGVTLEAAPDYLAAGAVAVGLGRPLLADALEGGDLDALGARAAALVSSLRRSG